MRTIGKFGSRGVRALVVLAVLFALSAAAAPAAARPAAPALSVTVSMERPTTHYYHVVVRADGLAGETQDFKLPVWTPGYYQIMDYAKNVKDFRAEDGAGRPLPWDKTAKNAWRVRTGRAATAVVSYDVYAFSRFVADSYLSDDGGFICPTGVFMHVAGRLKDPVVVTVVPAASWRQVSTGLDPVAGRPNAFTRSEERRVGKEC